MKIPPCTKCGACCSCGKKWVEVTAKDAKKINSVNLEKGDIRKFAMKTWGNDDKCVCLAGIIGKKVKCIIYEDRPKICRDVQRGSSLCLYMLGYHKVKIL